MVVKVLDIKNILQQKETAALSDRCVYGGTLYALRDIGAEINYIMCMAKSESKNGEAFFPKMAPMAASFSSLPSPFILSRSSVIIADIFRGPLVSDS